MIYVCIYACIYIYVLNEMRTYTDIRPQRSHTQPRVPWQPQAIQVFHEVGQLHHPRCDNINVVALNEYLLFRGTAFAAAAAALAGAAAPAGEAERAAGADAAAGRRIWAVLAFFLAVAGGTAASLGAGVPSAGVPGAVDTMLGMDGAATHLAGVRGAGMPGALLGVHQVFHEWCTRASIS